VEIFRQENVTLETEVTKEVTDYDAICAAMMVTIDDKELTLQQAAKFLEEPDRARRQLAWELSANRRYAVHERVEDIFDQLLELRDKIAANAGMSDFRAYTWKAYKKLRADRG
jgi:oligoendopeptidase F